MIGKTTAAILPPSCHFIIKAKHRLATITPGRVMKKKVLPSDGKVSWQSNNVQGGYTTLTSAISTVKIVLA